MPMHLRLRDNRKGAMVLNKQWRQVSVARVL